MRTYLKLAAATAVAVTSVGVFLSARADSEKLTAATNTAVAVGLRTTRTGGCAAPLKNGSVLITGGRGANGLFAGAETFSAKKGSADVAPMAHPRADHACATLPDGRVLVAGGITTGGGSISSAEVFNPASGQWALVGAMSSARSGIAAATLPGGKVLIAGGDSNGVPSATLEIFDPSTNRFSVAGQLSSPRKEHAAVSLADGKVLIAGGTNGAAPLDTIDVYDPKTGTVSPLGAKLSSKRRGLTATTLLDGGVYFAGGSNGAQELATAEIYNPKSGTITAAASMGSPRSGHTALRVPNNNSILIIGGNATGGQVTSMELYIPWQNKYRPFGTSGSSGGKAAVGGQLAAITDSSVDAVVSALAAAESQVLMAGEEAVLPTLTTDKADYVPGETVQISGTGWNPDTEITFVLARDPKTLDDTTWSATVDSSGNLATTYLVQSLDLGVTFTLTATGGSGSTAQIQTTSFTDGAVSSALISLYQLDCTTAAASFAPGETVCAKTTVSVSSGTDTFYFVWYDPSGTVVRSTAKTNVSNGSSHSDSYAVSVAGNWTLKTCRNAACNGDGNILDTKIFSVAAKTNPTLSVTNSPLTYNGSPQAAIVSGSVAGTVSNIQYNGSSVIPTNAGTYVITADFTPTDTAAYNSLTTASAGNFVINKAQSTTTVTCPSSVTYDGTAQTPCTAIVTGAGGLNQALTVTYADNTNAGTATASANFAGDANHEPSSDSKTFTIAKANSTTVVSCPSSVTYTGAPLTPCSAAATGVGGLNQTLAVTYANNTNAGTATASASFAGDANHEASNDSKTFTIAKASSTTVVSCPASVTYNGLVQTPCTANVTGAGGLNQALAVTYANNKNAGTATASASYAGDANHDPSSDSKNFTIAKAAVTATAGSGTTTYNGLAQSPSPCIVTGLYTVGIGCINNPASAINAGTYTISPLMVWGTELPGNFAVTYVLGSFVIEAREGTVRYIGQTTWVTSGSSSTTAQVTLSASFQDPTGLAIAGAKATFKDASNGTVLAKDITVAPVAGANGTGTANSIVTLSTGQYGAATYLIAVEITGNFTNAKQRLDDPDSTTGVLTVAKPGSANTTILGGSFTQLTTRAGKYAGVGGSSTLSVGLQYNKSGSSLQGQIMLAVPQSDGFLYVKSNSLSSMTITGASPKKSTIYAKASIYKVTGSTVTTIDGNVSLRVDVVDNAVTDQVALTVLSSKDSSLYYSSNWQNPGTGWLTLPENLLTGSGVLIQ